MEMNGADIIIECFLEQGVDTVFGYPGGAVLNIYDSLYKYSEKIKHILTAHEQGASHAADGYARTTGKTGVLIATSGPGATNIVTGLATAYMDSVPVVAITGNVPTSLLGLDSFQEVDIRGITMPITKHNYIVKDITKLADTIREAFYIANEGRKGPVLIDIPKDITAQKCEFISKELKEYLYKVDVELDDSIFSAVKMIKESKHPFIYAGGGVTSANIFDEFANFVELVDAPVSLSLMGQSAFDNTNARYTGMMGMHGTKTSSLALENCDLLIVLGSRFSDRVICNNTTFCKNSKILHIDIDPAEINKNIIVSKNITGDLGYIVKKLNKCLPAQNHSEWMEKIYSWKQEYPLDMTSENEDAVLPKDVLETLCNLTNGEAVITTEVGQNQMWAAQFYNFKKSRSFASSGGLGTMGYGLGASIGAKIANPDKKVINVAGDGSFFMNMNELSTVAKYNVPVIELILNNGVLGMVRQWQTLFYQQRYSQTTLEKDVDFSKLCEAFGIKYFEISKKSEIEDKLKEALDSEKPVLINCIIDKNINVLPMVPAGASIYEPILEISV